MSISILIAAYNEEATLRDVCERSLKVLKECCDDYEVVILNDESKDRTAEIMDELKSEDPEHIRLLHHEKNQGIAVTFEELYHSASKEYFLLVPGDGQYPPEILTKAMALIPEHDIVIYKRTNKNYTVYRQLISACYRWMPRILFGVDLHDSGSVKCMRTSVIKEISVISTSVFVEAERVIRAAKMGMKLGVVDFESEQRQAGKARGAQLSTVLGAVKDMCRVWFSLQLKMINDK